MVVLVMLAVQQQLVLLALVAKAEKAASVVQVVPEE